MCNRLNASAMACPRIPVFFAEKLVSRGGPFLAVWRHMKRMVLGLVCAGVSLLPACDVNEKGASLASVPSLTMHAEAHRDRTVDVYVSNAAQFSPPCPVFHANATLNGSPMQLVDAGGYVDTLGGAGRCARPKFSLIVPQDEADADVVILVEDESSKLSMRVQHLLSTPVLSLDAPSDHVLRQISRAALSLAPAGLAFEAHLRIEYNPDANDRAYPHPAGFVITDTDLGTEWSAGHVTFTVLCDDSMPSTGVIQLGKDADYFRLAAPIFDCVSATSCSADLLSNVNDSPRTTASYEPPAHR